LVEYNILTIVELPEYIRRAEKLVSAAVLQALQLKSRAVLMGFARPATEFVAVSVTSAPYFRVGSMSV
jgi:hypothetical protein